MSKLRVHSFSISIDRFGAGPNQDLENPLGVGGLKVIDWFFPTRTWQRMHGNEEGETGVDDDVAALGFENIGAYILGRNMFGPVRGPWPEGPHERKQTGVRLAILRFYRGVSKIIPQYNPLTKSRKISGLTPVSAAAFGNRVGSGVVLYHRGHRRRLRR